MILLKAWKHLISKGRLRFPVLAWFVHISWVCREGWPVIALVTLLWITVLPLAIYAIDSAQEQQ